MMRSFIMVGLLAMASPSFAQAWPWSAGDHRLERNRVGDLPGNRSDGERGRAWLEQQRRDRNQAQAHERELRRDRQIRDLQATRPYDGAWDERLRQRASGARLPMEGTQPPLAVTRDDRDSPRHHWRSGWRADRRYDWRAYREQNRWLFNLGNYRDPFGWKYRRFDVGRRLWPEHYGARYWLDDPWRYRLPVAHVGTRWIRYHGDVLLTDLATGEVIDIVHDVFW